MKKLSTLLLASLLIAGLSTGCKDKKTEEEAPAEQTETQENAQQPAEGEAEEAPEEEEVEEEEVEEEEAPPVDEAMFIKAAYEVSCVKAKIDNPEEQKEILEVIYPRYGFETVEDYAAAETALKDSASVKAALDSKMGDCTAEAAKGFKTAGAGEKPAEEAADDKDDKKAAKPKKAKPISGTFKGSHTGNGIQSGSVNCTAYNGSFKCLIVGKAEGKGFSIPVKGTVDASGRFSASGARGKNKASIRGSVKGSKGTGKIDLTVFERQYSTSWN